MVSATDFDLYRILTNPLIYERPGKSKIQNGRNVSKLSPGFVLGILKITSKDESCFYIVLCVAKH